MQVILMERIEKLGQMGDVVTVKPGYARNFLLPQGKARRATKANLDRFEQQRVQLETENLERRGEAEKVGAKLKDLVVTLIRQAGESGQLYGSVNTHDLAAEITEAGYTVARNQISLDGVIKATGLHQVKIRLHPEVSVTTRPFSLALTFSASPRRSRLSASSWTRCCSKRSRFSLVARRALPCGRRKLRA